MTRLALAIVLFATSIWAAGCPITITCEDVGCPLGERCNVETGSCEAVTFDCNDDPTLCRGGEVCDTETGECRPEQLRCTEQFTCPDGQTCNASSGFCEPTALCESDADCGPAEQCNEMTQACEDAPCVDDGDCPVSYICDEDNLCRTGCRPRADGCRNREFCLVVSGESVGRCVPNCSQDTDCPFGQYCDLASAPDSTCQPEGPCSVDVDCRVDEVCSDGACSQPPCSSDDNCLENQLCDIATGTCRAAACDEDNFGIETPNHTLENAFGIDRGTYTQLVLCPGRSDWFALPVRTTDIVRVRLQQAQPEPDIDLYVYDEDGEAMVANEQLGSVATLRFAAGREQVVFIEVRSQSFEGATYDLSITTEACRNDPFEENDSIDDATAVPSSVGVPTELALLSCGFDEDWFRLSPEAADNGLRVERVSGTPDLQVHLFTPDGAVFDVARDDSVELLRVGTAGDYFVRAYGSLGQTGSYRLAFEIDEPWECDGAGLHQTTADALASSAETPLSESLCPLDGSWEIDWIALEVTAGGILDLALTPTGDAPALEVDLLTRDDGTNEIVRQAVLDGETYRLQASVAPDVEWFLRVSSPTSLGRIASAPGYELTYSLR